MTETEREGAQTPVPQLNRREFLWTAGGGVVVLFLADDSAAQGYGRRAPVEFNAFLKVGADGRVTCFTGKIEMGQGIVTSLAQMLADELDVDLESVDMVMGDTDLCPWDMGTFGSLTTRLFGPLLLAAAAEARAVLLELAASRLELTPDRLTVERGVVCDSQDPSRSVSYAELTKGRRIERHLDPKPKPKAPSRLRIVGRPTPRRDSREKVTGKALYAGDVRLPGMLCARILRPPAHGAKLEHLDTAPAREVEGVQVVEEEELIAVLHEHPDIAGQALSKVRAEFTVPEPKADTETIFDHLMGLAPAPETVEEGGVLSEGERLATSIYEATYLNGYVAHAPIETHTAVAQVEGRKVTVWASTQTPFGVRDEVARALGFAPENVRVITPFVGAGFGGKTQNDQAVEAARLAQRVGRPVQVAWTRPEEFFYDTFRPAAVVKIKAGCDASGKLSLWDYGVYYAGERGSGQFYTVPHHRTLSHGEWMGEPLPGHPFRVGPWRAPANNTNTFARESHIDMLAAKAGLDPLELRLGNLEDPRMKGVLEAAAERFGWTPGKRPSGRGHGVACGIDAGTYVACMAEVGVDEDEGTIEVKRVVCAQDMGLVVNPRGARLQMEGCATMGLGYALSEEVTFEGGRILDRNFDSYELPRFSGLPEIETVLVDARDSPPQGGGEPVIICMGAVIANAVYDATGTRLFRLPMSPPRVKQAARQSARSTRARR